MPLMTTYPRPVSSDASPASVGPSQPSPVEWLPAAALAGYGLVASVEIAVAALDAQGPQWVVKPLMMPALMAYLTAVARPPGTRPILLALGFATAGDMALLFPGRTAFLLGMGFFLGTQVSYLVAFVRRDRPGWSPLARPDRPRWSLVAGYALLWGTVNLALWPRLGPLRLPVLGYSLALTAMASAATGVSRRVATGAAIFVLSDLLIGLGAAGIRLPAHRPAVTATYVVAQLLIVTGWVAGRPGPPGSPQRSDGRSPAPRRSLARWLRRAA